MKTEAGLESHRRYWNFSVRLKNIWNWRTRWAVNHLSKELKRDPGFRQSWHANIAMPIYDATRPQCICRHIGIPEGNHRPECDWNNAQHGDPCFLLDAMTHEQANYIADRLMKHLFGA